MPSSPSSAERYRLPYDLAQGHGFSVGRVVPSAKLSRAGLSADRYYFDVIRAAGSPGWGALEALLRALAAPDAMLPRAREEFEVAHAVSFLGAEQVDGELDYRVYFGFDVTSWPARRPATAFQWRPGAQAFEVRSYERIEEVSLDEARALVGECLGTGAEFAELRAVVCRMLERADALLHASRIREADRRSSYAFNFHRCTPIHNADVAAEIAELARLFAIDARVLAAWQGSTQGLEIIDIATGRSGSGAFVTIYHADLADVPALSCPGEVTPTNLAGRPARFAPQSSPEKRLKPAALREALEPIWRECRGSHEVAIAVIDGNVDLAHRCFDGASMTTLGPAPARRDPAVDHATHVASIIFGQHGGPVEGIAPGCSGIIAPALEASDGGVPIGSQLGLAQAIEAALGAGADIINISSGELATAHNADPFLQAAIARCEEKGVLVVAAAGNDSCACAAIPALLSAVLAVGATDVTGAPLPFSNWGAAYRGHSVLAPGTDILGAMPGGDAEPRTGTSYAAAIVTGVVGLLVSLARRRGAEIGPREVAQILVESARPCTPSDAPGRRCIGGRLDVQRAHELVLRQVANHLTTGINQENTMNEETQSAQHTDSQVVAPVLHATIPSEPDRGVRAAGASSACECGGGGGGSSGSSGADTLVFALGTLSIDFGTEARRDSFKQAMGDTSNPEDPKQMLAYLQTHPYEADRLIWLLSINLTPVYAVVPVGPYAAIGYERLREFLSDQVAGKVQRVSIPGVSAGGRRLRSGQKVPSLLPELRGMYSWSTEPLVRSVLGDKAGTEELDRLHNFLERVYDHHRNLGTSSKDRALNAATTNAFQVARIFESTAKQRLELDHIDVVPSSIARPGSDCWDVELTFFAPLQRTERARQVYRFTIDVSDVLPVTVGTIKSWAVY